jgi:hypothetical protein
LAEEGAQPDITPENLAVMDEFVTSYEREGGELLKRIKTKVRDPNPRLDTKVDAELSAALKALASSDPDDLTTMARMIDLWGVYRSKALADLAAALQGDQRILELRAEAQRDASRAARLEAEEAARRGKEISWLAGLPDDLRAMVESEIRHRGVRPGG